MKILRAFLLALTFSLAARASVVTASFSSAATIAVTADDYTASGNTVALSLGFAPPVGTSLMIVKNTGVNPIAGTFDNLAQGQRIVLAYSGINYNFVANYHGGTGNDLVLQWADNKVYSWGYNGEGELGNGTTTNGNAPGPVQSPVLARKTILSVATSEDLSLALCSDGSLFSWGEDNFGGLADGQRENRSIPVEITSAGVLAGKTVVALAGSWNHGLALCSDGTLASWGSNEVGQLGNNSSVLASDTPVDITSSGVLAGKSVIAIAAAGGSNLVLCSDGTLAAWGNNNSGQLGNGSTAGSVALPVAVSTGGALLGKTVTAIAAGNSHRLVLCSDGTLAAWGLNTYGELGNGTTTSSSVPVTVLKAGALSGKTITAIGAGINCSRALCSDGTLTGWGLNTSGQLGISTATTSSSAPVASAGLSGKTFSAFSQGAYHAIILCSDGSAAGVGRGTSGQTGFGTTIGASAPSAVSTSQLTAAQRFTSVVNSGSANHNLAIVAGPPLPVALTSAATNITGTKATFHGIANADSNDATFSFEYGTTTSYGNSISSSPSLVTGSGDMPVAANVEGLLSATTYHYRLNGTNALGTTHGPDVTFTTPSTNAKLSALATSTGTLSPSFSPTVTGYAFNVPNATASLTFTLTLADSKATATVNGIPVTSGTASAPVSLAVGMNAIPCVVTAQDGVTVTTYTVTIIRYSANADLASLVPGGGTLAPAFAPNTLDYACSVPFSTTAWSFTPTLADSTAQVSFNGTPIASGTSSLSYLLNVGANTFYISVKPQDPSLFSKSYTVVVTRQTPTASFSSASDVPITANGFTASIYSLPISLNFAPAPGTQLMVVNNTSSSAISGTFSNLADGQVISLGYGGVFYRFVADYHGGTGNDLVLRWANTRLLSWGYNSDGQLGNTTSTNGPAPAAVVPAGILAGKTIRAVATGEAHSLALCTDGTLAAWGSNSYGQLGNDSYITSLVPVPVVTSGVLSGKTVVAIAAGQFHNLALCSDGTLAAWGYNVDGQLGDGTNTTRLVPISVGRTGALSGKTVVAVAAGIYQSFAVCSDGKVAGWGYDGNGELGDGGSGSTTTPVAVVANGALAGKLVRSISTGSLHTLALCSDGTLAAWGFNYYGQLGNGGTSYSNVPVLVATDGVLAGKTVIATAAGSSHSLALCSDGTLAAWGSNNVGQLGDGTTSDRASPVLVRSDGTLAGKTISGISAGAIHSLAKCADGTVESWGANAEGELGNNTGAASSVPVAASLAALLPGETILGVGTGPNSLHSLAIVASPPLAIVTTLSATSVTDGSAILKATVNANGWDTNPIFDYGLTSAYGTSVQAAPALVSGSSPVQVSAFVAGLLPATTYHFRIRGNSAGGTSAGEDVVFTTPAASVSLVNLTLNSGTLSPGFSGSVTSYSVTVPNATSSLTLTPTAADPYFVIKVNGIAVSPGVPSPPINLSLGSNTVTATVFSADLAYSRTYSILVTRLYDGPEIVVERAGSNVASGATQSVGYGTSGRSSSVTFTIRNIGNADLAGLQVTKGGADAGQFTLASLPTAPLPGFGATTTFTIVFSPTGAGSRAADVHIASNDGEENPFTIHLTGTALSFTQDTDGDGLSDAAEFQMEALGFDWQVSQPALVSTYFANAGASGLYTAAQMQSLQAGAPLISRDPVTGDFKLTLQLSKSSDLTHFTPFPMSLPQLGIDGEGRLEFRFTPADNAAFYRLEAK